MKVGIAAPYDKGFLAAVDEIAVLESAGLDVVYVAEAYGFDAISQLGFLAARTTRLKLASGIVPIYSRTPALTAMTAAGLDYVSDGRFILGLGASGPQVIEGFHGVPYDAPLGRTREVVEICRAVWRREVLVHDGPKYHIPLPPEQGTGLGKALKLINHPVRADIPVLLAAVGPRNVALAAELANVWEPFMFVPEFAGRTWGESLAAGKAKRDPALDELEIAVGVPVAIGENVDELIDRIRPWFALYIGGMGARDKNFYNALFTKFGYVEEAARIQDLYLVGKKAEAEAVIPREFLEKASLIGPASYVAERLAAYQEAGATTLNVMSVDDTREGRLATVEALLKLVR